MILNGFVVAILLISALVSAAPQISLEGGRGFRRTVKRTDAFSITNSIVNFTVDLSTNHLKKGNAVFSPLSITSLLNLFLLGATDNTYTELRTALKYPADADDFLIHQQCRGQLRALQRPTEGVTVDITSRIFANRKFRIDKEYRSEARDFYQASVESVDFARRPDAVLRRINTWVNDHTNGKIPQLLTEPLPNFTQMVAANVVYFNSSWQVPFNPRKTAVRNFVIHNTETVRTNMMSQRMTVPYERFMELVGGFEVVGLPYSKGSHGMFVFLPKRNTERALDELERFLTSDNLEKVLSRLSVNTLTVEIPRFKMRHSLSLRDALLGMGVSDIFSANRASLERLSTSDGPLYLDDVIHQAVIDVHERGTVAAAATAGVGGRSRFGNKKFTADKPFLFVIRDNKTGVPLFWGRLVKPDGVSE